MCQISQISIRFLNILPKEVLKFANNYFFSAWFTFCLRTGAYNTDLEKVTFLMWLYYSQFA